MRGEDDIEIEVLPRFSDRVCQVFQVLVFLATVGVSGFSAWLIHVSLQMGTLDIPAVIFLIYSIIMVFLQVIFVMVSRRKKIQGPRLISTGNPVGFVVQSDD
jgi:TRAP-type C4-dicarboxylate transport system permease small subunit